ncbi:unnamed protein product, partial [Allacma fusca]
MESTEDPKARVLTPEQAACEKHYSINTTREPDGTYTVRLPFKQNSRPLRNSKFQDVRRLEALEAKLYKNPALARDYKESMRELINDGHMKLVPPDELDLHDSKCYYLPHHTVVKDSSTTTKTRIVFDASARTTSGESLNQQLMVGATIQDDLFGILCRWRQWNVPISADIKKLYLFVNVHPEDRNFQRVLWRETNDKPVRVYRLKKVTFGTASAPFQAIRTLHKLAEDYATEFPEAVRALKGDVYVDDAMTGAYTVNEALALQHQLLSL